MGWETKMTKGTEVTIFKPNGTVFRHITDPKSAGFKDGVLVVTSDEHGQKQEIQTSLQAIIERPRPPIRIATI
jgi:hypothetical protein